MATALRCLRCGKDWSVDHANSWGHTQESSGMGPDPKCTALIPDLNAPKARTADPSRFEVPNRMCGGQLMPVQIQDGSAEAKAIQPVKQLL